MLIFEESSLDAEEIAFDEKGQGIDVFCYWSESHKHEYFLSLWLIIRTVWLSPMSKDLRRQSTITKDVERELQI